MNETPFTPGICRENRNFRFLSGEALTGLGNELGLCLPQEPHLPVKQKRSDGKISKAPGLPGAFLYLGACDRHVLSYG